MGRGPQSSVPCVGFAFREPVFYEVPRLQATDPRTARRAGGGVSRGRAGVGRAWGGMPELPGRGVALPGPAPGDRRVGAAAFAPGRLRRSLPGTLGAGGGGGRGGPPPADPPAPPGPAPPGRGG